MSTQSREHLILVPQEVGHTSLLFQILKDVVGAFSQLLRCPEHRIKDPDLGSSLLLRLCY